MPGTEPPISVSLCSVSSAAVCKHPAGRPEEARGRAIVVWGTTPPLAKGAGRLVRASRERIRGGGPNAAEQPFSTHRAHDPRGHRPVAAACGLRRGATALRSAAVEQQSSANGHIRAVGGRRAIASRQPDLSRSVGFGKVGFGSRPAYRGLPMAGPVWGLQRSKPGRMSALSRNPVVVKPSSKGPSLATNRPLDVGACAVTLILQIDGTHSPRVDVGPSSTGKTR
jgi:hypothetical protein